MWYRYWWSNCDNGVSLNRCLRAGTPQSSPIASSIRLPGNGKRIQTSPVEERGDTSLTSCTQLAPDGGLQDCQQRCLTTWPTSFIIIWLYTNFCKCWPGSIFILLVRDHRCLCLSFAAQLQPCVEQDRLLQRRKHNTEARIRSLNLKQEKKSCFKDQK